MSVRGFTLVELLVAAALVLVIALAVALLASGMRRAFEGSLVTVDLTARSRAALAAVTADVHAAGTGVAIGPALHRLADVTAVVIPRRSLEDATIATPFGAVTVIRATGNQGVIGMAAPAGAVTLQIDPAAPSTRQDGTAGLRRGDLAVVFDTARAETVNIADASAWTVTLEAGLRNAFSAGAYITAIERVTYGLRRAGGNARLVRRTTGGAEQPVVDHVGDFEVVLFGVAEAPQPPLVAEWFPTYGPLAPPIDTDDERDLWPAGENCTLSIDAAGQRTARLLYRGPSASLVRLDAALLVDGPWCPESTDLERFDADLLRLARVDLRLHVVTPPGADGSPVPPVELTTSVAIREK